ncbi:MAG: response regulator transcription factor [Solirubrobacterales bacterium]
MRSVRFEGLLAAERHRPLGNVGVYAREVEVLRLLARGLSNKESAGRLVISPKTAGNHVEHIYAKIDASNRAGGKSVRGATWPSARSGACGSDERLTPP